MTGKRHPFLRDLGGRLRRTTCGSVALRATLTSNGGWSLDLSEPVLARALCHIDNAYWIPQHRGARPDRQDQPAVQHRVPRLRRPAGHDRDRGHPRPLRAAARRRAGRAAPAQLLRAGPDHAVRAAGPARRAAGRHLADPDRAQRLRSAARPRSPRSTPQHADTKRGLAITPVKFGISFNLTAFNQAGALVHVYKDGSVLINHGGTEMGQGLHTKMIQVAATALGVPLGYVRLAPTRTDKVPNTSATAASSGADLNGGAIKNACDQIRERLNDRGGRQAGHPPRRRAVRRRRGHRDRLPRQADHVAPSWSTTPTSMRVPLWAAGFYRTAGLHWDAERMQGEPFKYFAYGASVSEVEVDGFTGAYRLLRDRHRARRRRQPVAADRPRPDRGRLRPGRRLADPGGAALGRERRAAPRPAEHPGGQHVQDPELLRDAGGVQRAPVRAGDRVRRGVRLQGGRRAAADARPSASARRCGRRWGRSDPQGHSVDLGSPATPEAVFWAVEAARAAVAEQPRAPTRARWSEV